MISWSEHILPALGALVLGIGFLWGVFMLRVAWLIWAAVKRNPSEFEKNRARVNSVGDLLIGRVKVRGGWLPDHRVQGGIVYNRTRKRLEVTGRFSDETLRVAFSPPTTPSDR